MSDQKPPISNDLSLYADEIDEMLAQRDKEKMEAEREKRANLGQNTRRTPKRNPVSEGPEANGGKPVDNDPKSLSDMAGTGQYGNGQAAENLRKAADERLGYLNTVSRQEEHDQRVEELRQHNRSNGAGFVPINVDDLPTKGIFYPVGTKIFAKAASLGEIKNWSLIDETELTQVDEGINSIIESCVNIVFPNEYGYATWRDLKEIDRLYIVLAVHDFTFPANSGNDLKVVISETEDVVINKDRIDFVKFSDKLMKYYDPENLCFSFPTKNIKTFPDGYFHVYVPSVGVNKWVKEYMQAKIRTQETFDQTFIQVAPLLIKSHKNLNMDTYYDLIDSTADWTPYEWALLSKVRSNIEAAITPKVHYISKGGAEKEAPLQFRGGIKAIFQQHVDIDL